MKKFFVAIIGICFACLSLSCKRDVYLIEGLDGAVLKDSYCHIDGYINRSRLFHFPKTSISQAKRKLGMVFKSYNLDITSDWSVISANGDTKIMLTNGNVDLLVTIFNEEGGVDVLMSEISYH